MLPEAIPSNRSLTATLNASPGFSPSAPATPACAASNACFTAASDFADTFFTVVSRTAMVKVLSTEPGPLAASPVVTRLTVSRSSLTNSSTSASSRTVVAAD